MPQLWRVGLAWIVGAVVYVIAAFACGEYDGFVSIILWPLCGLVGSGVFVGLALVMSTVFRVPRLHRVWQSSRIGAVSLALGGTVLMIFRTHAGLTEEVVHPETGRPMDMLHPAAALGGYFGLLFAIVNWPEHRRASDTSPPALPSTQR